MFRKGQKAPVVKLPARIKFARQGMDETHPYAHTWEERAFPMPKPASVHKRCPECMGRGFTTFNRRMTWDSGNTYVELGQLCYRCDGRGYVPKKTAQARIQANWVTK